MPTALATTPLGGTRARHHAQPMTPLERWTDGRLDDLAKRVDEHTRLLDKLTDVLVEQGKLSERLHDLAADVTSCLGKLEAIVEGQGARDEQQRKERKADRKWLFGTVLVVCALVISALGVFLG